MKLRNRCAGFTLTEIAIVMLIIGLALAATVMPVGRMFQASQIGANQERLDTAREALLTFASVNGRLPCPDRNGDGLEDQRNNGDPVNFGCLGNFYEGFLPWATIGVAQTDYWGTRLRYRVSVQFTRSGIDPAWTCGTVNGQSLAGTALAGCTSATAGHPAPGCRMPNYPTSLANSCVFDIADAGDVPIRDGQPGRTGSVFLMNLTTNAFGQPLSHGAAAVVLSHGANKFGGTEQSGTVFAAPPAGSDEALNGPALGAIATGARASANPFIARPPLDNAPSGCNDNGNTNLCNFDDQLVYFGANVLISRMVQAGLRLR